MSTLSQRVDAPTLQPPTISLVRAATTPADSTSQKWAVGGIRYLPEASTTASVDDSCGPAAGTYTYTPPGEVEYLPYAIFAYDQCSMLSSFSRDYVGRASRILDAATPKAVEREFWTGTVARAKSWPNLYLQKASTVTDLTPTPGTAVSLVTAFELLEQGIANTGSGSNGMIHLTRRALPELNASGLSLRREGNLLKTLVDTIVVPGVGYTGNGPIGNAKETPDAGTTWVYATGLVEYRQTDPIAFPDWPPGERQQVPAFAVDRATNTVRIWAERTALASWDGQCHLAVLATIPT